MLDVFIPIILFTLIFLFWNFFLYSIGKRGIELLVTTFIFVYGQIISTEMLLGFFSLLLPGWLLIINAIIVGFLYLLGKKKNSITKYFSETKESLTRALIFVKNDKPLLLSLLLCLTIILWVVFLGLIFPVLDWDGNSYHMTFIGNVLQNHNIFDTPASLGWINGYPKSGELITLWNVIFTRNDIIADLVQVPFIVLAVSSIYGITKRLGAKKENAAFASLLFISIPIVINQLKTTYLDVMLPALFFACVYLLIKKRRDIVSFLAIGVATGIIFTLKPAGVLFVAIIGLWLFALIVQDQNVSFKNKAVALTVFSIPIFIGSYWYFKNLIIYQNPVYPYGFQLFGHQIFPGKLFDDGAAEAMKAFPFFPKGTFQRMWFVWTEQKDWWGCLYNYDANFSGFGPVWFVFVLPALLVQSIRALLEKNSKYLLLLGVTATLLLAYPLNYYARYTIFIWGIGLVSIALTIDQMGEKAAKITKYSLLALSAFAFASTFCLCNYPPLTIKKQLQVTPLDDRRGTAYQSVVGPAYLYIQDHAKEGDVVTYSRSSMFIYPLWNRDYSNKVIYFTEKDPQKWLNMVKQSSVDYVFTHKANPEAIMSKENKFEKVFEDVDYEVYKTN